MQLLMHILEILSGFMLGYQIVRAILYFASTLSQRQQQALILELFGLIEGKRLRYVQRHTMLCVVQVILLSNLINATTLGQVLQTKELSPGGVN
jgi:hypothetical protein